MTARTGSQQPVGSSDWILKEFSDISNICENELEDFTFSARNEVEWLNEHMHDIFTSRRLQLAEILKTPGKLRGKTPRTARQRSPLKEIRQPLGEIASISKRFNSPLRQRLLASPKARKSQDGNNTSLSKSPELSRSTQRTHDSGYHGDSGDEMEVEIPIPESQDLEKDEGKLAPYVSNETLPTETKMMDVSHTDEGRSTEGSFHSAKENQNIKDGVAETNQAVDGQPSIKGNDEKVSDQLRRESAEQTTKEEEEPKSEVKEVPMQTNEDEDETNDADSEESTPARTHARKSSLNFAPLPAREPLKKSMGNVRASSQAGWKIRMTGGKSLGGIRAPELDRDAADHDQQIGQSENPKEDETTSNSRALQNKYSTQRLADRINALGKAPISRPTKSVLATVQQPAYPSLPEPQEDPKPHVEVESEKPDAKMEDQEDDGENEWNEHDSETASSPNYQVYPSSEDELEQLRPAQVPKERKPTPPSIDEHAPLSEARISTTPAGSPPKAVLEQQGPVFASKSKLQSLMQSARGLFSSSAVASAEAKLEATSVSSPKREQTQPVQPTTQKRLSPVEDPKEQGVESRAVSNSTEEMSRKRSADHASETDEQQSRPGSALEPPSRSRNMLARPTRERPAAKAVKEQPAQQKVSIKMGSGAGRRPLTIAPLSTANKEQDLLSVKPATTGKESIASQSTTTSSNGSMKSSMASKAKALLAAERKRENEEKAAQKRAEQKREAERKKAAQQAEAQKREQERQAAERQKERERQAAEEKKRQEQRQAVEKKRAETLAKREQMQKEHQALKSSTYRPEHQRPVSRQAMALDFPRPPSSAAGASKQAQKRTWKPENDDETIRPTPSQANAHYQQQNDGKRRKTEDEEDLKQPQSVRPTMAPPMRPSNIKNGMKTNMFPSGNYPIAPPPAMHHTATTQSNVPAQQLSSQLPPRPPTALDNARFQNGAIPFANGAPAPQQAPVTTSNPFKTPMQPVRFGQPGAAQQQQQQQKSSPFVNGEYVHLDEIPTDSEDEDSETERDRKADLPDWVRTPVLNETLMQQETINPDSVFGPIAPLNMEEMFKGRGPRKDFRSRTSSANWFGGDRLTEDEIKRDMEAREKIQRDGGWSFGM